MGQLFEQKYTNIAYHGKFDYTFAGKHWKQLQNQVPFLEGEPAMILESVIMEYKL